MHLNLAKVLDRSFYDRNTLVVARELLGKVLVREYEGKILAGVIVETEAYRGFDDPASHAYRGKTPRNAVMFGPPGRAYVYLAYGINHLLNIVTEREGFPAAVLIRALQPVKGIEEMKKNRGVDDIYALTSGPGRLTKAMRIDLSLNGIDMTCRGPLYVVDHDFGRFSVGISSRIGISAGKDRLWRFYIKGNRFVSRRG
ncbi:DNA-3-methyladenine glycosylase [archaeon]|nr:MAG: DNA-3-methyladenine glycosylase [archaeon]RLG64581.1 MAG: DNA-3-methyladenine glycosylase [archaeon]